jgi:hypothetical protein
MKNDQLNTIVLLTVLTGLLLGTLSWQAGSNAPGFPQAATSLKPSGFGTMVNWHAGTDKSENGVSITYTQTAQAASPPGIMQDVLYQKMDVGFNDGSNTKIEWMNIIDFLPGGLNIAGNVVLDWNKVSRTGLAIQYVNDVSIGETVVGGCGFAGFSIMKGNATDASFGITHPGSGYNTFITGVPHVATITFVNATSYVGPVNTSKSGSNTIVVFTVLVNASIVDFGGNSLPINANITVQIVHTPARNIVKYGVELDWSSTPLFPTDSLLVPGDHFFLATNDLMTVAHDTLIGGSQQIVAFTMADNNNDTALFSDGGVLYGTQHFTQNYTIRGEGTSRNTTRIYFLNASSSTYGITSYSSVVFVLFDGFVYGTSTGLSFDPSVELPYAILGPLYILIGVLCGVAAVVVVGLSVFAVRRRKKLQTKP